MPQQRLKSSVKGRAASKALRRQQLIKSTIDSIAKRGFADTTLANVADGAGLSRGIVNFHFKSKNILLIETLKHVAEEYRTAWNRALANAGPGTAEALQALVLADFEPGVCNRKKIAVWSIACCVREQVDGRGPVAGQGASGQLDGAARGQEGDETSNRSP